MKAAQRLWIVCVVSWGLVPRHAAGQVMPDSRMVAPTSATAPTGASTMAGEAPAESASGSAWSWIKMPKITMPKIEMPKMPADPLAPIKTSARKVNDGAKKAWEGTKELFTFGQKDDEPTARVAARPEEQTSIWKRLFGGGEEKPQTPQTVADWMAQPRVE